MSAVYLGAQQPCPPKDTYLDFLVGVTAGLNASSPLDAEKQTDANSQYQ